MMKLLMQTSAIDLDARDASDRTPLMYAAESGHISIVKLLLDTGRVKDGSDQASYVPPAAWSAAESIVFYGYRDQIEVLKMLLNEPSLNANYRSENGETLLIWAARQGQLEIVELILECGKYDITAVNHAGRSAFSSAAGTSLLVMQCLYRTGQVDINQPDTIPGCSPVWVAVEANYRWSLEWLLSHDDVDVTRRDRSGYTLLEYAVTNDLPDMMSALLASPKVDPNTRNKHGETPLHRAAIQGNDKLVKRLVDSEKVDVNAGDKRGRTPVSWAVEMGANAVLKALLSSGRADIRVADLNGVTPLALAKRNRSSVCVQLMWNSGQLDCRLEYDGETEPRRPVDFQAQEYIDTYLTDARLDWPSTSRG
jgi:ankyrin repeat protein